MLDMRLQTDRWELARRTGLPVQVLNEFRPTLTELDCLDDEGEDCAVACNDGVIEAQFYGTTSDGVAVNAQCCRSCVGKALSLNAVDPYQPVEIEYLPLVPRAGVTEGRG